MGAVYQGVQLSLDRVVAIKIIASHLADDADYLQRFNREARTLGRLLHPNVIACHDVLTCHAPDGSDLWVMVLEFVDGWSLGSLMKKDQLTVRRAVDLHRQAAEALAYAHEQGVIHRDIKPDNIMVTKQGKAKVADFGLAKCNDSTVMTHTGVLLGSPAYMSPEACLGQAMSSASDLYSLGCSLFHCLTGAPPFPASGSLQTLNLHVNGPIPLVSSRCPDLALLDPILSKLLAKKPEQRYADGHQVARVLKDILSVIPGHAHTKRELTDSMAGGKTLISGIEKPSGNDDKGNAIENKATMNARRPSAVYWGICAAIGVGVLTVGALVMSGKDSEESSLLSTNRSADRTSAQEEKVNGEITSPTSSVSLTVVSPSDITNVPVATDSAIEAIYDELLENAEMDVKEGMLEGAKSILDSLHREKCNDRLGNRYDALSASIDEAWEKRYRKNLDRIVQDFKSGRPNPKMFMELKRFHEQEYRGKELAIYFPSLKAPLKQADDLMEERRAQFKEAFPEEYDRLMRFSKSPMRKQGIKGNE